MKRTLQNVEKEVHEELKRYIRAAFNISNESVNRQRDRLLDELGVIKQNAYVESTPKYTIGEKFESIDGLPPSFQTIVNELSDDPKLIFNPPYSHQLESIRQTLVEQGSSLVMTGTGSGKTESFLWPILGKIAAEAEQSKKTYELPAMRALMIYPMNALVNDQLGRIRELFADSRLKETFRGWEARIPTFARYTSRTFYPGKKSPKQDKLKLEEYKTFFKENKRIREDATHPDRPNEIKKFEQLNDLGKWPAKDNLEAWYENNYETQPNDSELLTRHEVHKNCPDLLITNTSMLRYMMVRPIERNIFNQTKKWLQESDEKLLIVLDEAHLYSGTQATEIALVIRRLIDRLDIESNRIQVIMTSASFNDQNKALSYVSKMTSVDIDTIIPITGKLKKEDDVSKLSDNEARLLEKIDPEKFLSLDQAEQKDSIEEFVRFLQFNEDFEPENIHSVLYSVLKQFPPLNNLINLTMGDAQTFEEIEKVIFSKEMGKDIDKELVLNNLFMLATHARPEIDSPSLLPTRQHLFLRGLAGLWACMNPECDELEAEDKGGPIGKLYSQPIDRCKCGSQVLEYFTCKLCGADFAKAYIEDLDALDSDGAFLWSQSGSAYISSESDVQDQELKEVDLYLGTAKSVQQNSGVWESIVYNAIYDFFISRLDNGNEDGETAREVFITKTQYKGKSQKIKRGFDPDHLRKFYTCPSCNQKAGIETERRSPVENHQTKGIQPLKAITSKVFSTQPPNKKEDRDSVLGGRKVLFFSDSREKAADLPKKYDDICLNDGIRPLIALGYKELPVKSLDYLYGALMLGSVRSGIRLRAFNTTPGYENLEEEFFDEFDGRPFDQIDFLQLLVNEFPYKEFVKPLINSIFHKRFGYYPLAIASVVEKEDRKFEKIFKTLESFTASNEEKLFLIRLWLNFWIFNKTRHHKPKFSFVETIPNSEFYIDGVKQSDRGIAAKNLFFRDYMAFIEHHGYDRADFIRTFEPIFTYFTESHELKYYLDPNKLAFKFDDDWGICKKCTRVGIFFESFNKCIHCLGELEKFTPSNHRLFNVRTDYYRKPTIDLLNGEKGIFSYVSKEHTAQLNATSTDNSVFSYAEMNELTFQGVKIRDRDTNLYAPETDLLSSTTTMEVGIDIGSLDAVGLRGMPPSRANYQQRSGRAGRRGNSMSTVFAWGNVDSHDNQYFSNPKDMVSGPAADPYITLNNQDIASRHVNAYILENFLETISDEELETQPASVFGVLGTVKDFRANDDSNPITIKKLEKWVRENESELKNKIRKWLPNDLEEYFDELLNLDQFLTDITENTDHYEHLSSEESAENYIETIEENDQGIENGSDDRDSDEVATNKILNDELLEQLMLRGVLPKSGFPADIVNLNVFNTTKDEEGRKIKLKHAPSYPSSAAITAYAPGAKKTINGKVYSSHGIYSFDDSERETMFHKRQSLFKCESCGYLDIELSQERDVERTCKICNATTLPSKILIRPVGFAHARGEAPVSGFGKEARSGTVQRKTRMNTPTDTQKIEGYENISYKKTRDKISFTNEGPGGLGFDYCKDCGRLEVSASSDNQLNESQHIPPHPKVINGKKSCDSQEIERNLFLGTEILTDILFVNIDFHNIGITLKPGETPTRVVLETFAEAIARAASEILQIDPSEISAIYRHTKVQSLEDAGKSIELILFDTIDNGAGYSISENLDLMKLITHALSVLKKCEQDEESNGCDSSCYGCLNSFGNKYRNSLFDRHLAIAFIESLLAKQLVNFKSSRIKQSNKIIQGDLERLEGFEVSINQIRSFPNIGEVEIPLVIEKEGKEIFAAFSNPITSNEFIDEKLTQLVNVTINDVLKIEELQVRRALPQATNKIIKKFEDG